MARSGSDITESKQTLTINDEAVVSVDPDFEEEQRIQKRWLWMIITFYGIDLVICTLARFGKLYHSPEGLFITEGVLSAVAVVFGVINFKHLKPLFTCKRLVLSKAVVYGAAAILFAIAVNLAIKWLNKSLFNQDTLYFRSFRNLPYPRLGIIFFVALLPAFFEELAYRGIILEGLFHLSEEKKAIFLSAILFALIHMNFFSFFWLLPFAIWLGNVRWKEGTIWYSILIHFCFNITACLFEFYDYS
ncbi:MAG: CPBP family intramembrane glutamic endopeptidase [Chitinophagaceae bacterium]